MTKKIKTNNRLKFKRTNKTKKRRNALTSTKVLVELIPEEYKNSIYYDSKNFNDINKNILDSNLLDNEKLSSNDENQPFNLNKLTNGNKINTTNTKKTTKTINGNTTKKMNSKILFISTEKSNINGKVKFKSKVLIDNSKSPYIKEYININGKKTLKQIKK